MSKGIKEMKLIRNLVVLIDGTDCDFGKKSHVEWSNVARIYHSCERLKLEGDRQQIAQYFDGVGARKSESVVLDKMLGMALGERVEEVYGWLKKEVHNAMVDGVEAHVYLFGFSRGAFAVRWLAALLDFCGVPTEHENKFEGIVAFTQGDKKTADERIISGRYSKVSIDFLGVFDTVKARPGSEYGVRVLPVSVLNAYHAMAIDEWRSDFDVLPFNDDDRVKQMWFAGGHSDIGGGYGDPEADDQETLKNRYASDVAYDWVVQHAKDCGLLMSETYVPFSFDESVKPVFHDARTWYYKLSNIFTAASRLFLRTVPPSAVVHPSVETWLYRYDLVHANWSPGKDNVV